MEPGQLGGDLAVACVSSWPLARASARRATADTAAASRRRRLSCHGGGHTSMQAAMQKAAASVQPMRRGPMADAGWATATGRTKVSRAAVVAVAACGATIPVKSTAKPTTAIVTTAATLCVETTVPRTVKQAPTRYSPP